MERFRRALEIRQKLARRTPSELKQLLGYEQKGRKRKGAIDAIKRVLEDLTGKESKGGRGSRSTSRQLGQVVERVVGVSPQASLERKFEPHLN